MIIEDLVFDVGAHIGGDTAQYLRMGYRVIAVEASPAMAATLRERFSEEIAEGRVALVEKANQRDGRNDPVSPTPEYRLEFHARQSVESGTIGL